MKLGSIADFSLFSLNTVGSKKLCGLGKRISLQLVFKCAIYDGVEDIGRVLRNGALGSTGDEEHPWCRCSG